MGARIAVIVATLIAIGAALALPIMSDSSEADAWHVAQGALDSDCAHGGSNPDGSVQFIPTCPASSRSLDGVWTLQTTKPVGPDEAYQVLIADRQGRRIGPVPNLNDHMPFVLRWSPRPRWFLINHWVGSFMETPRVFEITDDGVVEHDAFKVAGQAMAIRLNPCLGDGSFEANCGVPRARIWAAGTGQRWSRDGRRLIWNFATRTDACMEGDEFGSIQPDDQWQAFYMISEVESGKVDPASIRMIGDDDRRLPTDGPYADF
jgi:hypothetical protein